MRLFKFIISITLVTLIALVYVHQQVELMKMSYRIGFKQKDLERILDWKETLGYNIKSLESPSRLEKVLLSERIDITFPKRGNIVKAATLLSKVGKKENLKSVGVERKANVFGIFEFLGLKAEAQAKER